MKHLFFLISKKQLRAGHKCNSQILRLLITVDLCCLTKHFLGRDNSNVYSSQTDKTKVQFGESMSFMGLTFRNMGKELHIGLELTQGQLLPLATPPWVTPYKNWEPGAHCTTCRQLNSLESVLSKCCSWFIPLSGSSASFFFSKATSLFSRSSL